MKILNKIGCNQRIIHWWLGTDALKLVMYPPGKFSWRFRIFFERLLWRLIEPLIKEHWIASEHLRQHLLDFGIDNSKIKVKHDEIKYGKCEKKKHIGFNILYYCPDLAKDNNPKFKSWLYGWDYYILFRDKFPQFNWIRVDGTQDLAKIFPIIDFYFRPTRHDGYPRLVEECKINGIPVYWRPDFDHTAGMIHFQKAAEFFERVFK